MLFWKKKDWKPRFLSALKIRPVVPKKNFYLVTNNHFTKEQEFEKHPKDEYRSVTQTHPLITSRPLRFYLLTLWRQLYSKLYIKDVKTRDSLIHLSSGSVGFRFLNLDICQFCLYMYDKLLSCFSVWRRKSLLAKDTFCELHYSSSMVQCSMSNSRTYGENNMGIWFHHWSIDSFSNNLAMGLILNYVHKLFKH